MNGLLLVDKPSGPTSHDVVDHIRRVTGLQRVGHTGTLDPNAGGLMVLCLGKATRIAEFIAGLDKTYEGTMRLGLVTDSYDIQGNVLEENDVPTSITLEQLREMCHAFVGTIEQTPPMVSAVRVGGRRLYKLARKGITVERPPRTVQIYEFSVLGYTPPDVYIRVRCSSGTYVRSLCHDIGRQLGCGAILAALRRTYVGNYSVEKAKPLEYFQNPEQVQNELLPLRDALNLPSATVSPQGIATLKNGGVLLPMDLAAPCAVRSGIVQIKNSDGELLALGEVKRTAAGVTIQPRRVFITQND